MKVKKLDIPDLEDIQVNTPFGDYFIRYCDRGFKVFFEAKEIGCVLGYSFAKEVLQDHYEKKLQETTIEELLSFKLVGRNFIAETAFGSITLHSRVDYEDGEKEILWSNDLTGTLNEFIEKHDFFRSAEEAVDRMQFEYSRYLEEFLEG